MTVHDRDGSSYTMNIQSPNKNPGFSWSVSGIGSSIYEDMDRKMRKGTANKRALIYLHYSSHKIDLSKILVAKYVTFDLSEFNLPFQNRDFRFNKTIVTKNWKSSLVIAGMESGETLLEFTSTEKYSAVV